MNQAIREQILFVLEDDNEVMTAALDSDLDEADKQRNRKLIQRHERIIARVEKGQALTWGELLLVRDANQIHLNDERDLAGGHRQAVLLDEWLKEQTGKRVNEAVQRLEAHLDKQADTPPEVYRALHVLWEEATYPEEGAELNAFDEKGRCLRCGSSLSLADATDTVLFVGDEITKSYPGDISNRNCIRCTYPELYSEYKDLEN
jgi:hypothetical protein